MPEIFFFFAHQIHYRKSSISFSLCPYGPPVAPLLLIGPFLMKITLFLLNSYSYSFLIQVDFIFESL